MNDMSGFRGFKAPRQPRPLYQAMKRGLFGRCPCCGRGRLFRSYLKVVKTCSVCGEDMSHQRADDAPAYLTLLLVCHFVCAGVLMSDEIFPQSSLAWTAFFWLSVAAVVSLILLPRFKGAVVGQQWAMGLHGFGAGTA